jgi:uncharacterized protein
MTVIRLLLLLIAAWFLYQTVRRWLMGAQPKARGAVKPQRDKPVAGGKVVKCTYCDVHLPEQEAVQQQSEWFCSAEHARLYISRP